MHRQVTNWGIGALVIVVSGVAGTLVADILGLRPADDIMLLCEGVGAGLLLLAALVGKRIIKIEERTRHPTIVASLIVGWVLFSGAQMNIAWKVLPVDVVIIAGITGIGFLLLAVLVGKSIIRGTEYFAIAASLASLIAGLALLGATMMPPTYTPGAGFPGTTIMVGGLILVVVLSRPKEPRVGRGVTMLTRRLVEKVLGVLSLILWGPLPYATIPAALNELPSHQALLAIIGICLPLFIPFLLLSSEGFWARHIWLTTVLGLIWGLLAALGGFVLVLFLLLYCIWPRFVSDFVFWATLVWLIAGILLLWEDAAVIVDRLFRKR